MDTSVRVELLAHVGAGRQPHVVGRREHQDADRVVLARRRQVLEHLVEHLCVHGVADLGAIEAQERNARLVDVVGGQGVGQSITSPSGSESSEAISSTSRSVCSAARSISAITSSSGSEKREST